MALALGGTLAAAGAAVWYFFKSSKFLQWERVAIHQEARSLHAAAVRDGSMLIVGGCCKEVYLNEVLVLDLEQLTWSKAEPCPIACAGHSLVAVENKLVLLAGIPSDHKLRVYVLDGITWSSLPTNGDIPLARRGHSATLIGSTIWIFGGEDMYGNLLNDMYILDLETKNWERVDSSGAIPPPVAFHGVASYNKQLSLFGGRTGHGPADFSNVLYVFDCHDRAWLGFPENGIPRAQFGSVPIGTHCYVVGGGVHETTVVLTMPSRKTRVVSVDNRIVREGFSLVEGGQGTLFAAGIADDAPEEFGVFRSKPCRKLPKLPAPIGSCEVVGEDGSVFEFQVSESGKTVRDISEALEVLTGRRGSLKRKKWILTAGDMIHPGDRIAFSQSSGPTKLRLWLMDASDCRAFLAQMEVRVTRGVGWLDPRNEIEAEPFAWKGWPSRQDMIQYLTMKAVDVDSARTYFSFVEEEYVYTVSSRGPKLVYELQFRMQFMFDFMGTSPLIAFCLVKSVEDVDRWRAMVLLLALNIKCSRGKPWMVISDLKDDWEFAWMDGNNIFTSRAHSRKQALGILRDLARDYDKVTREEVLGQLSGLPTIFARRSVDFTCDEPIGPPILFKKEKVEGGVEAHIEGTKHSQYMEDEYCWYYPGDPEFKGKGPMWS